MDAAGALSVPALIRNHTVRLLSFFGFECCVGMFWPCLGVMRSRYARTTDLLVPHSILLLLTTNDRLITLFAKFQISCCVMCVFARYVPEEVRATTMNLFRVPLN